MEDPNDILHNGHNKLFTVFDVKWMKVGVTLSKFTLNDDTFSWEEVFGVKGDIAFGELKITSSENHWRHEFWADQ